MTPLKIQKKLLSTSIVFDVKDLKNIKKKGKNQNNFVMSLFFSFSK